LAAQSSRVLSWQSHAPDVEISVEAGYDRWARSYDTFPNPILAREERYVLPVLPPLEGKHALDLACGTGRWLELLIKREPKCAVGIDLSSAMLDVARTKPVARECLLRADCTHPPFASATFDFAICSFALSHVCELRSFVNGISRIMKPRSDLFLTDIHPEAAAMGWRTGFRDDTSGVSIEVFPRRIEKIVQVFVAGGFECITHVGLCLGKPEKPIFVRANREAAFERACRVPAIYFAHFRRVAS
jgi:malonyl-CoA O-methyltransferase